MGSSLKILKNKLPRQCDMGCCANKAEYFIAFEQCGGGANLDICKGCLGQILAQGKKLTGEKVDK